MLFQEFHILEFSNCKLAMELNQAKRKANTFKVEVMKSKYNFFALHFSLHYFSVEHFPFA